MKAFFIGMEFNVEVLVYLRVQLKTLTVSS
jgi:hypothetical protein